MQLIVGASYVTVGLNDLGPEERTLAVTAIREALTVSLDDARTQMLRRQYHNPLIGVHCLYSLADQRFPTGLLGAVLGALHAVGLTPELRWTAGYLPPVEDVSKVVTSAGHGVRDYQLALVEEAAQKGRGVIHAATSSGKTAVIGLLLRALGAPPSLVVVGSRSLVRQTSLEIAEWLGEPVGVCTATRRDLTPNVVVGLVQSLAAGAGDQEIQALLATRRVLVVDECHHVARSAGRKEEGRISGGQWFELAQRCTAAMNRYGFSATPLKLGDKVQNMRLIGATGPLLENVITATTLIDKGFAARPFVYWLPFDAPKIRGADYPSAVRLGIVENVERNTAVVDAAETLYQEGLKVLILVEQLQHGRLLEGFLRSRGVPVAFVHGGLSLDEQEEHLTWLREDGPRVCVSTRVLGEGTNVPSIGAVVYARGGKAFVSLFQGIGRGLRAKGKPGEAGTCFVLIPEDDHHKLLKKHADLLRVYLAGEPGYRVAVPGQPLREFVRAVVEMDQLDVGGGSPDAR